MEGLRIGVLSQLNLGNATSTSGSQRCTLEVLTKLSERLGARWKELIPKLGLPTEVEKEIAREKKEDKGKHSV